MFYGIVIKPKEIKRKTRKKEGSVSFEGESTFGAESEVNWTD